MSNDTTTGTVYRVLLTDTSEEMHRGVSHPTEYDDLEAATAAVMAANQVAVKFHGRHGVMDGAVHEIVGGVPVRWHGVNMQTGGIGQSGDILQQGPTDD